MKNKDNKQTIGAQIPGRLYQLINLHSLVQNQSKSQIIRDALLLWADQNNVDINELLNDIQLELKAKWLRNKNDNDGMSRLAWEDFQRDGLKKYNVSDHLIDQIFKHFWK